MKRPWESQENADRRAADAKARRERYQAEDDERRRKLAAAGDMRKREAAERAFARSPKGRARAAREDRDHVFQISFDLEKVGLHDPRPSSKDYSVETMQAIIDEGWSLHSFSTAFVLDSMDISQGYSTGVRGRLLGTYIFTPREPVSTSN
jgi:hypothetical protein